jgi:hypothetical protein
MELKELTRDAIAHFIRVASNFIPYGYWFTVRGECNSSLCVHTMLHLNQHAELLYIAGSIRIGKRCVEISEEKIRNSLSHPDYELQQLKDFYSLWPVKTHYD